MATGGLVGSGAEDAASITVTLAGSDVDGTIASYTLSSLPAAAQGVLYTNSAMTAVAAVSTVYTSATLYFKPAPDYNGTTSFDYTVTDNQGLVASAPAK